MTTASAAVLDRFEPLIADWFRERHGEPTDIQALAWPRILDGENLLATAPTGSGKTLCAFLVPLDHLLSGRWQGGCVRVLYVSPLKALNNDIRRNLLEPLAELRQRLEAAGEDPAPVRVATRSGDTPPDERRHMLRDPPEILITTPESLNILLTSAGGRAMLGGLRMVIMDEIHAVAGSRRGLWLMNGVEALVEIAGEFQRVALSATVRPLEDVARLVGGHASDATGRPDARPRPVCCLRSAIDKRMELSVRALPADPLPGDGGLDALTPIARAVVQATRRNRSTLVFTNSRAQCEKLALRINAAALNDAEAGAASEPATDEPLAFAHHGSLSREIRLQVEERLRSGRLRALVATSTLEMGIDIGDLDEVLMVQTPPSIAATIQRAGRAGHGVGETSRAVLHPTHPHDVLEAATAARAALAGDIEATRIPGPCLDVLAQMIITRIAIAPRSADALFDAVRCVAPYRELDRTHFDSVLAMLLGRHEDRHVRELQARLLEDPDSCTLSLRRGTLLALYAGGGMINDRGYYQLRHAETGTRIGELDEEFVWENGPGAAFTFGSQQWRVQRVTHNDVLVLPAPEARHAPPFWRSEDRDRDSHFSQRLQELLAECENALAGRREALDALLATLPLDAGAAAMLAEHLVLQRAHTGVALPHRGHLVVECISRGPGDYRGGGAGRWSTRDRGGPGTGQLVLHTFAGGQVNRPWALALQAHWQQRCGERPEVFVNNDVIVVQAGADIDPAAVPHWLTSADLVPLLRGTLADSGTFGARFRECAGRALLLSRSRIGERLPLWMSRLQSQRLLDHVRQLGDFPIVLEAWRSCLEEGFDLDGLGRLLTALEDGTVAVSVVHCDQASPFAAQAAWRQINEYMYADDRPRAGSRGGSRDAGLTPSLLDSVMGDARLRPRVTADTVSRFLLRRLRLEKGWGPRDALELQDWLRERRLLDPDAFAGLCVALPEPIDPAAAWQAALERGARRWIVHARDLATVRQLLDADPEDDQRAAQRSEWLMDWLAFRAPATVDELASAWPGEPDQLAADLAGLEESGVLLRAALVVDDPRELLCLRASMEAMLRLQRSAGRSSLAPLPAARVPGFLARWQRVGDTVDIVDALEPLRALPLAAGLWERALLPARTGRPCRAELDALLAGDALRCVGHGAGRLAFLATDELDALPRTAAASATVAAAARALPDPGARYDFGALRAACADDPVAATTLLWEAVFAGVIGIDSFEPVRHGLANDFSLPHRGATEADSGAFGSRRSSTAGVTAHRGHLRARIGVRSRGVPGRFFLLPDDRKAGDEVDRIERARLRAAVLLDRWGVISPTLLQREARGTGWRELFRALRLMELAGEVTGGLFLAGLDGPQFASPEALRWLQRESRSPGAEADSPPVARWMDARDPASPCGLHIELPGAALPARRAGAELILLGDRVALVSERSGRSLTLAPSLTEQELDLVLAALARTFSWREPARFSIRQINAAPARSTPIVAALRRHFEVGSDHRDLLLSARIV